MTTRHRQALELDRSRPDDKLTLPFRRAARPIVSTVESAIFVLPWGPAVDVMFDPQYAPTSTLTVRLYALWEGSKVLVDSKTITAGTSTPVVVSAAVGCDGFVLTAQLASAAASAIESLVVGFVYEGAHAAGSSSTKLSSFASWSSPAGAAYESSRVIKPSAGTLFQLFGFNAGSTARYVQIHDASAAPGGGTPATAISFPVDAGRPFSLDLGDDGLAFATGMFFGASSDGQQYTADATATFWLKAKYL